MQNDFPSLENLEEDKLTIDLTKANIMGLLWLVPITLVYVVPFYLIWKERFSSTVFKNQLTAISPFEEPLPSIPLLLFILLLVGIIIHELVHGITWSFFAKNGFKSIKFGILLKMLTPYCHCQEPLKVNQYLLGAAMPAIVLGIIPALLALLFGHIILLSFGTFFTIAAIGDFMIINLVRKENKNTLVLDHPTEAGCYVYRAKSKDRSIL